MSIQGSCLCKSVRSEIAAGPTAAGQCPCSLARKWSGSALLSFGGVKLEDFRGTQGEELLGRYPSSPASTRVFCSRCGSGLAAWPTDPAADTTWIMLGALDGDPGVKPEAHIFVA